ncbi:Protein of unknown function DUF789 [Dillenia turbinata]|uniref:Uncharacterized protein n=1 Tax=Dillenia turbinata TaxID=194707 RepID=A0AAN8V8B0_9MAGN
MSVASKPSSISRSRGGVGVDRFYNPPPVRRRQQQQQLEQQKQREMLHNRNIPKQKSSSSLESNRIESSSSSCSSSPSELTTTTSSSNLDRFLEHTNPFVSAQFFSKTRMRELRSGDGEVNPYFVLGDLWESFKEWSVYGAGVPLVLNGSESVIQYYVPYLSGIQLFRDPSMPSLRPSRDAERKPAMVNWNVVSTLECEVLSFQNLVSSLVEKWRLGEDSDSDSFRETSSDGSSEFDPEQRVNCLVQRTWCQQNLRGLNNLSLNRVPMGDKPSMGSSSDEGEFCSTQGQLIFEYLERDSPFSREPLADKASIIAVLASQFPELRTCKSCDLTPASWIAVAWYPIYRIPTGPTLQNLDACFLTFHSLSTPLKGSSMFEHHCFSHKGFPNIHDMSLKLTLPTFGLASYKFKVSVWNPDGTQECQKAASLLQAADNWLRLLQVHLPDYSFFVSRSSFCQ